MEMYLCKHIKVLIDFLVVIIVFSIPDRRFLKDIHSI